jgi:hypothetical protein
MRHRTRTILPALALLLAGTAAEAQHTVYGVTGGPGGAQQLVRFESGNPTSVTTLGATGANLTGIDFRPANGMLYGYNGTLLYTISLTTGAATPIFDVGNTAGGNAGFDFNPTVDRIRVTDTVGTNLRLNPNDGATTVDGAYTYAAGDVGAGQRPAFAAVAYTNNDTDPATGTTLYGIDANLGRLVLISNPNGGTVSTVGGLGLGFTPNVTGFDIVTVGGVNSAFFSVFGVSTGPLNAFYSVNLTTGAATLVGAVGVTGGLQGIAIVPSSTVPEPGSLALLATGLAVGGLVVRRRRARG